jgi:hypothetical protein
MRESPIQDRNGVWATYTTPNALWLVTARIPAKRIAQIGEPIPGTNLTCMASSISP